MATRTDRLKGVAVRAAQRAKQWARVVAREADRLLVQGRQRVESEVRRRRLQKTLKKTGRVLKAAGEAALVAGLAAGVAAARAEQGKPKAGKGRRR